MTVRTDELGRYYTRESVASILINAIDTDLPRAIVDLGAGAGTLIAEAAKRWTLARYITIDIDQKAASGNLPHELGRSYRHHVGDALDPNIEERLNVPRGGACIALCNPPYIRPRWQTHFRSLLEEVGLDSVLPKARDLPADLLFVAQCLRLLRPGGQLGLILPDGLIAGEKFTDFRRALVAHHSIRHVIELPRSIFRKTEAKAHILVLARSQRQEDAITVRCLNADGSLSTALSVSPERASERLDYSFHVSTASKAFLRKQATGIRIGDLIEHVSRGSFSSSKRMDAKFPVFHTSDLSAGATAIPKRFILKTDMATGSSITAKAGDLLVARVGRRLEQKICTVSFGKVIPSDCFLRVRPRAGCGRKLLELLTSSNGRASIERISHGVGAQFITIRALVNIRI